LLLCAAGAAAACGYGLSGTTSVLPERVRNFTVMPFENRTNRPEIEQRVTEEVSSLLSRRGKYRVVTNVAEADAVLSGAITAYQTTAVQFNEAGRATRIEAVVQMQALLRETAGDEVLWSQAGLVFRQQFPVPDSSEGFEGGTAGEGGFFDRESVALDEIARGAAQTLVNSIFEGF